MLVMIEELVLEWGGWGGEGGGSSKFQEDT